jgi:hypothetical protein
LLWRQQASCGGEAVPARDARHCAVVAGAHSVAAIGFIPS